MRDEPTILYDFNPLQTDGVRRRPVAPAGHYRALPCVPAMLACTACSARQDARQVVVGEGPVDAVGMVIGQGPGEEEDKAGVPFIGPSGDLLDEWLHALGLDRRRLVVTNAIKCYVRNNRPPRVSELRACFTHTVAWELEALTALQVVFAVGKPAVSTILGKAAPPMTPLSAHRFLVQATGRGEGAIFSRELHVFPLPHPAFLLRARHLTPLMGMVLTHVRRTLERELPEAYRQMGGR